MITEPNKKIDYFNYDFPSITRDVNVALSKKVPVRGSVRLFLGKYYDANDIMQLSKSIPDIPLTQKLKVWCIRRFRK